MTSHYMSLRDHIARRIVAKDLKPGGKLPSERLLQAGGGVARGTIREALFQLEAEGLIYRRERSGWYVSPPPVVYDPTRWAGFMTYVAEQGRRPATETLSKVEAPWPDAADAMCVEPETPLYVIRRRRMIDERPVLVERILVDPRRAPGLIEHNLDDSLIQVLKTIYGLEVSRNLVSMRPCALVREEAQSLGVKSGTPGLLVVRKSLDTQGNVVEYDHEYWRHDAICIEVNLQVMGS